MAIAIVGAGLTGLAAAYDLSKFGYSVDVYDSALAPGGLASGFKLPQWSWFVESYYHHWFLSDRDILRLIRELGWQHQIKIFKPKTVAWYRNAFFALDSISAILTFPGFNLMDSLRFGGVTAYLKFFARWPKLESETASSWLDRWYGPKISHLIWQPLLEGKFGRYADQVNMAWMWARLKTRTTRLATFEGGFQQFINQFVTHLQQQGVNFYFHTPINQITSHNHQIILTHQQQTRKYEACLVTTSPKIFSRLVKPLPSKLRRYWQDIPSLGAIVMVLSLKYPISKNHEYWYNLPKQSGFPFLAFVEHTQFVPNQHFNHDTIVYCGDYCDNTDPRFKFSDSELLELYLPALKKINPHFKSDWIKQFWVFKTPYAQPIPLTHHSQKIPPVQTPIKNLYYASMNHIYPWDRGTNYAVRLGRTTAQKIHQAL